jgi:ABC-type transporter Mla maintaining outer membrane lipid asymmetry ATPase subunit MlaF
MSEPLIKSLRFENFSYGYEGGPLLFEGINFDLPMFRTVWIHGEAGHGSSSIMQVMAGLLQPSGGKYLINNLDASQMTFEEFLPYRLKIGYGFDFGGLLNNRTLLENLTLPLEYHKVLDLHDSIVRACEYLDFLGLLRYRDQRPAVVPGGVRKLTCMLRALILHPEVLLLDDPSVGMNEETVLKYFKLVSRLRKKDCLQHVFISSFDQGLLAQLDAEEILICENRLLSTEVETKHAANG